MATERGRAPRYRILRSGAQTTPPGTMPRELCEELDDLALEILGQIDDEYEATTPFVRDEAATPSRLASRRDRS